MMSLLKAVTRLGKHVQAKHFHVTDAQSGINRWYDHKRLITCALSLIGSQRCVLAYSHSVMSCLAVFTG